MKKGENAVWWFQIAKGGLVKITQPNGLYLVSFTMDFVNWGNIRVLPKLQSSWESIIRHLPVQLAARDWGLDSHEYILEPIRSMEDYRLYAGMKRRTDEMVVSATALSEVEFHALSYFPLRVLPSRIQEKEYHLLEKVEELRNLTLKCPDAL